MSCEIFLENYHECYTPGEKIIGRIQCNFDYLTELRCIKIEFERVEFNKWHVSSHTYIGYRELTITDTIIYGTDGNYNFLAGSHDFPFILDLPKTLPSSYVGRYSLIAYHLKVVVERPRLADYKSSLLVNIFAPILYHRFPPEELTVKKFQDDATIDCYWCCKSGKISMVATMPRMVFVPSDTIDVEIKITNLSNYSVRQLCVNFDKMITLKVTHPSSRQKIIKEELFKTIQHGVGAHGEHTFNLSIPIPMNIDILNFSDCKLMKVDYLLLINASLEGFVSDFKMEIYPNLANLRTLEVSQDRPSESPSQTLDLAAPTVPPYENVLPSYQSLEAQESPPPTYNNVLTGGS